MTAALLSADLSTVPHYEERVYAALLGKVIGVYLGRPVEGWPYAEIQSRFGEVATYINDELDLPLVVADDDISGALVFARVALDHPSGPVRADLVGDTWLNYIIERRTILWWGGFGRSTEHTAFQRLLAGVRAPASGSATLNGAVLSEQVGAQIFSDAFALMHPGDPDAAVAATRAAASVSHDGVAVEAAGFLAAMRAEAFVDPDLVHLIEVGRAYVSDPRLQRVVADVVDCTDPDDDWREARDRVDRLHGYAVHPGPCHSLSNLAMSLTALLLGGGDLRRSLMVAASAGFDTDSNAGTVGCLQGVRLGLEGLSQIEDLRAPVSDRVIVVSADGGEAVTDVRREARALVQAGRQMRGWPALPASPRFDFALPGAVQGFTVCPYLGLDEPAPHQRGHGLDASLVVPLLAGRVQSVSTPTFLDPREESHNFNTVASGTLYPTETVRVRVRCRSLAGVRPYVLYHDESGLQALHGPVTDVSPGPETTLTWEVPTRGALVPFRFGLEAILATLTDDGRPFELEVIEIDWSGGPREFVQNGVLLTSIWDTSPAPLAPWVSSAIDFEADFASTFSVSHPGPLGVVTIGTRDWTDYSVSTRLLFSLHDAAGLVARARGHRRFCAALFDADGVALVDQVDGERRVLARTLYPHAPGSRADVELQCRGDLLTLLLDGREQLRARTVHISGGAGFIVETGTVSADGVAVRRLPPLPSTATTTTKGAPQ